MSSGAHEHLATSTYRRRRPALLIIGIWIVLVFGLVMYGWSASKHSWSAAPTPTSAPYAVTGVAVTEGGPPTLQPGHSDVRPDAHATLLITGTDANGAHIRRTQHTDRLGRFALRLPPGTYTVSALVFGQLPLRRQPHADLAVLPGKQVHVRLKGYVN